MWVFRGLFMSKFNFNTSMDSLPKNTAIPIKKLSIWEQFLSNFHYWTSMLDGLLKFEFYITNSLKYDYSYLLWRQFRGKRSVFSPSVSLELQIQPKPDNSYDQIVTNWHAYSISNCATNDGFRFTNSYKKPHLPPVSSLKSVFYEHILGKIYSPKNLQKRQCGRAVFAIFWMNWFCGFCQVCSLKKQTLVFTGSLILK